MNDFRDSPHIYDEVLKYYDHYYGKLNRLSRRPEVESVGGKEKINEYISELGISTTSS
jgi:hypothetical protein